MQGSHEVPDMLTTQAEDDQPSPKTQHSRSVRSKRLPSITRSDPADQQDGRPSNTVSKQYMHTCENTVHPSNQHLSDAYPCASSPSYALLLCFGTNLKLSSTPPKNISEILTQSPLNGEARSVSSSLLPL
jgi:hypothetical protein